MGKKFQKIRNKRLEILMATVILVVLIVGVFLWKRREKIPDEYAANVVFIAPMTWERIAQGVQKANKDFHVSTKYITFSHNEEKQIEAMKYAILSNVDGIITTGMRESEQLEEMVQRAKTEGIPVVFVDSDVENSSRDCYIGCDNVEIGRMAGRAVVEANDGCANVCLVVSSKDITNQKVRISGFQEIVGEYRNIRIASIVEGNSNIVILQKEILRTLKEYPEIDTLVFVEGAATRWGEKILKNAGFEAKEYQIICMDYLSENEKQLLEGTYYATVFQDQFTMGYEAVKYIVDLLEGKTREEKEIFVPIQLMTRENVKMKGQENQETQEEVEWYLF